MFSNYFSEQLEKLKVGSTTIKAVRQTSEYAGLQRQLADMHAAEVTKELSCELVTNLHTPELKARLELMSPARAQPAPAPTGMKQTDLIISRCCTTQAIRLFASLSTKRSTGG